MRFWKSKADRQAAAEEAKRQEERVATELEEREKHYRQVAFEGLCNVIENALEAGDNFLTVVPKQWREWNDLVSAIVRAANDGRIENFWFPPPGDLHDHDRKAILKISQSPAASRVAA